MGEYGYDTQNLRVMTREGGVGERRILLDGIEELAEYNVTSGSAGTRVARYDHDVTRVDALLAQVTGSGAAAVKVHPWVDALGSVYGLGDTTGTLAGVQARYAYDVYGAREQVVGAGSTKWGFTGRVGDGGTGLGYNRERYLDAVTGGWLQDDPLGNIDGPARYRYVVGQPTVERDPLGTTVWSSTGLFTVEGDCASGGGASSLALTILETIAFDRPLLNSIGFTYIAVEDLSGFGPTKFFSYAERGGLYLGAKFLCQCESATLGGRKKYAETNRRNGAIEIDVYLGYFLEPNYKFRTGVIAHELAHAMMKFQSDDEVPATVFYPYFPMGRRFKEITLELTDVAASVAGDFVGSVHGGHFPENASPANIAVFR